MSGKEKKNSGRVRDCGSWSYEVQGGGERTLEIDQLQSEDAHNKTKTGMSERDLVFQS